jgi:hypothetical protein
MPVPGSEADENGAHLQVGKGDEAGGILVP